MPTSTQVPRQGVTSTLRRDQTRRVLPWMLGLVVLLAALGLQSQL